VRFCELSSNLTARIPISKLQHNRQVHTCQGLFSSHHNLSIRINRISAVLLVNKTKTRMAANPRVVCVKLRQQALSRTT